MFVICVLFFIIGIMTGFFATLLFFRFDKQWKQVAIGFTGFAGSAGIGMGAIKYFAVDDSVKPICFIVMYVAIIISSGFAFYRFAKEVQTDDSKLPIRKLDIILGYDKYLEKYYEHRNLQNNIEDMEKKEAKLRNKEENLKEIERRLEEQLRDKVVIKLPKDHFFPVTNHFIGMIPIYTEHIYAFRSTIDSLTNQIIGELVDNDKTKNQEILKGYFAGIGMYVSNDLFGITDNGKEIRTHFRINKNGYHIQYTVIEGKSLSSTKIHDIPVDKDSLISKSYELKSSLIASINSDDVFDVKTVWDDFMTITYYDYIKDNQPFLSMGISIKNKEQFFELLVFLNFCRIEDCLQVYVERVNEKCNIVETLG